MKKQQLGLCKCLDHSWDYHLPTNYSGLEDTQTEAVFIDAVQTIEDIENTRCSIDYGYKMCVHYILEDMGLGI